LIGSELRTAAPGLAAGAALCFDADGSKRGFDAPRQIFDPFPRANKSHPAKAAMPFSTPKDNGFCDRRRSRRKSSPRRSRSIESYVCRDRMTSR
jgi:hypothetical protein